MLPQFKPLFDAARRVPVLGLLIDAALKSRDDHAKDMSASIAFFTLLSVLPLILGLASLAGLFLDADEIQLRLVELASSLMPAASDLIERNIENAVRSSGGVGLASVIVLTWSGRKMVGALSRGINSALGLDRPFAQFLSTFRNLVLTLAIGLLLIMAMTLAPVIEVLAALELEVLGDRWNGLVQIVSGYAVTLLITAVLLGLIYILIPYKRPGWRDLAPGLVVAVFLIEVGKQIFAVYVGSVSRYDAVFGSISSVIMMLFWLYFSAWVVLYGAEVMFVNRQSREQDSSRAEHGSAPSS